jgi:protein involved in polysaccharide export with SLBB domain
MPSLRNQLLAALLAAATAGSPAFAQQLQPDELPKRPSAEYFTTRPGAKILLSVNIWGEVFQPGVHFIPVGSTLTDALGSAGGPTGLANVPKLRLVREGEERYVDFMRDGSTLKIQDKDMVYVDRTFKSDLPLIFAAVSSAVSIVTLYYVSKRR